MQNAGVKDRVIVVPTASTIENLLKILGGCPFDYDRPELWNVTVYSGANEISDSAIDAMATYPAGVHKMDYWYDEHTSLTNLVLVLDSPALRWRNKAIEMATGVKSEHPVYVPSMVLVHGFPELTRSYKLFVNSISSSLNHLSYPLEFTSEMLMDSNGHTPNVAGMQHFADKHG